MTLKTAIKKADRLAKQNNEWYGVFFDDDYETYEVLNEIDADNWYGNDEPVYAVG